MADEPPTPKKKKSLLSSKTVQATLFWLAAHFGVKGIIKLKPEIIPAAQQEEILEGIMIFGIASIAIFMRRGLIRTLDTPMEGETEESRQRLPKPIYRSMTVLCSILMVVGWCMSKFYFAFGDQINHGVIVVGIAAICIFLRRGMLNALG
jgi:hypothetical protein